MNTTFIIGNGFDIRLGMATRYNDFYKNHYVTLPSEGLSPALQAFRGSIDEYVRKGMKAGKNDIDWSDLEVALGSYAGRLKDASDYIEIVTDINTELERYISIQDKDFRIDEASAEKLFKDFCKPDVEPYLSYVDAQSLKNYKRNIHESEQIGFLSFNYTNTIENIFSHLKAKPQGSNTAGSITSFNADILHIHSQLGKDQAILVGVNDPSQISNPEFRTNQDVLDVVVKPETNKMFGNGKITMAKNIIATSKLIVLYGLSLGDTDKMWWQVIRDAMINNSARLIYFAYEVPGETSALRIGHKRRELINTFFKQADVADNQKARLSSFMYIAYNTDIFHLPVKSK